MKKPQDTVQLKFHFLDKVISLRCPSVNQVKIELAAKKINEKLLIYQKQQPKNTDNFRLSLMVCLQFAFQNLVSVDEIDVILETLKEIREDISPQSDQESLPLSDLPPSVLQTSTQKNESSGEQYGKLFSKQSED